MCPDAFQAPGAVDRRIKTPMASKAPQKTPTKKKPSPRAKPEGAKPESIATKRKAPAGSRGQPNENGSRPASARGPVSGPKVSGPKVGSTKVGSTKTRPIFVPRAMSSHDDDDVLMAHGGGGAGYGRCGGRLLSSKLEQQLCNRLGIAGVVHSHSPRHYEVRYSEGLVAAYAPQIVLRGRGREGKSVVVEAVEEADAPILRKVIAFREQYGQEFYVIMVAADEVLDELAVTAYDESCSSTNVNTLIARLAE